MSRRTRWVTSAMIVLMGVLAADGSPRASATAVERRVDPDADRILLAMGEYLRTASEFSFHAEVSYDAIVGRQMIQYGGVADIFARRPDRLYARFDGDERNTRTFFDGRAITIFDARRDLYAVTEVPPEIGEAIDAVFDKYGFSVPLADLVYADPYAILSEHAEEGFVVGVHDVDGTPCHHLAFAQEHIDWQIWIEQGPWPVPRKVVITYKTEPGQPQYTARLARWDFQPRLSEHAFQFHPSESAAMIEFRPVNMETDQ